MDTLPTIMEDAIIEDAILEDKNDEAIIASKMLNMHMRQALTIAWEYFYKAPYKWKGNSSFVDKKTIVEYNENMEWAHYKEDGTFYALCTDKDINGQEYGILPIYYDGEFEINKFDFEVCFKSLHLGKIIFKPYGSK
jgi:hypothetical protein